MSNEETRAAMRESRRLMKKANGRFSKAKAVFDTPDEKSQQRIALALRRFVLAVSAKHFFVLSVSTTGGDTVCSRKARDDRRTNADMVGLCHLRVARGGGLSGLLPYPTLVED